MSHAKIHGPFSMGYGAWQTVHLINFHFFGPFQHGSGSILKLLDSDMNPICHKLPARVSELIKLIHII